jgi:MoaA/NifB/PqqE/SkfB family radical SAM enzyme
MEAAKYLNLSKKILQNKMAARNLTNASLFRLDIAVTWKCNSKCSYCKVWKMYIKDSRSLKNELTKEDYKRFFDQVDVNWIHVTGGEPFLREDLPEILEYASEKIGSLIIIDTSTNGLLTDRILEQVKRILENIDCKFVVGVSIDGPSDIHTKSRGVVDSWNRSITTYLELRKLKKRFSNFDVHINHFLSPINMSHFDRFVEELKEKDINFDEVSIEVARASPAFMNEGTPLEFDKNKVIEVLKKADKMYSSSKQDSRIKLRKRYISEMIDHLSSNKRKIPCAAGQSSVFIDPYGNVRPCGQLNVQVGNIKQNDMKTILESEVMKEWMKNFKNCQLCLSGCEGITSIVQNLPFSLI